MIYDKIDNLEIYTGISDDIRRGLEWLRDVNPDIENGVYEISSRVKVVVSEYITQKENESGYEAHSEYIDIHFLLKGAERICFLPVEHLKETKAYCGEIDTTFYKESGLQPQENLIGNGYFAIYFPHDGHKPGLSVAKHEVVKKIVVKVKK